jgi:hypothetical protein
MTSTSRLRTATFILAASTAHIGWTAETASKAPAAGNTARPGAARGGSAKGPLPDPALLDGSTQPAEKKSEYGMIGDFELPGDENARSGKVGGPQGPGGSQPQGVNVQVPGLQVPGLPMPSAGGPPGGLPQPPGLPGAQGAQAAGGGKEGGQQGAGQDQNAAGKQGGGAGEQGGQAGGIQVAELGGQPSGESALGTGEKPQAVAIGDSAMRIPSTQAAAGVVGGAQQAHPNTQHHEKGTGTGGKTSSGASGANKVERGRSVPAGL